MAKPKIVLGLVGKFCSGKGSVVEYLVDKHGFIGSSFSDRIREEIKRRNQEITRESLQAVAGELRRDLGPTVLAERTWEQIDKQGVERAVIETLRSVEEVEFCRTIPNFYLINIEADSKVRFERMKARNRESDPQTWEDFLASEERDLHQEGRDMEAAIAMADSTIENNGSAEELHKKLDQLVASLEKSHEG